MRLAEVNTFNELSTYCENYFTCTEYYELMKENYELILAEAACDVVDGTFFESEEDKESRVKNVIEKGKQFIKKLIEKLKELAAKVLKGINNLISLGAFAARLKSIDDNLFKTIKAKATDELTTTDIVNRLNLKLKYFKLMIEGDALVLYEQQDVVLNKKMRSKWIPIKGSLSKFVTNKLITTSKEKIEPINKQIEKWTKDLENDTMLSNQGRITLTSAIEDLQKDLLKIQEELEHYVNNDVQVFYDFIKSEKEKDKK